MKKLFFLVHGKKEGKRKQPQQNRWLLFSFDFKITLKLVDLYRWMWKIRLSNFSKNNMLVDVWMQFEWLTVCLGNI